MYLSMATIEIRAQRQSLLSEAKNLHEDDVFLGDSSLRSE